MVSLVRTNDEEKENARIGVANVGRRRTRVYRLAREKMSTIMLTRGPSDIRCSLYRERSRREEEQISAMRGGRLRFIYLLFIHTVSPPGPT